MPRPSCLKVTKWFDLVLNLVSKEIKVRYMGAALGFLWSLGNPLAAILTYYVVFTYILPNNQDRFALHLVTGIIHWMLLSQVLLQSGDWLINNNNLIRKLRFPRILLPLSNTLTIMAFWIFSMMVYAMLFPLLGGVVTKAMLWYPAVLLCFLALIVGGGLVFSVVQVTFRDTKHILDVVIPLFFWLTPIVWMTSSLPASIAGIVAFNPIAPYFNSFNSILHDGVAPKFDDLMLCLVLGAVSLIVGLLVFRRVDKVVEHL